MSKIENPKYFCAKSDAFPSLTENIIAENLILISLALKQLTIVSCVKALTIKNGSKFYIRIA